MNGGDWLFPEPRNTLHACDEAVQVPGLSPSGLRQGQAVLTGGLREWRSQPHPRSPADREFGLSPAAMDGRRAGRA